jgi:hypothetical protein
MEVVAATLGVHRIKTSSFPLTGPGRLVGLISLCRRQPSHSMRLYTGTAVKSQAIGVSKCLHKCYLEILLCNLFVIIPHNNDCRWIN